MEIHSVRCKYLLNLNSSTFKKCLWTEIGCIKNIYVKLIGGSNVTAMPHVIPIPQKKG